MTTPNPSDFNYKTELREQIQQLDTSGTSGTVLQQQMTTAEDVFGAPPAAAPTTPAKFPTGEDTEVQTVDE